MKDPQSRKYSCVLHEAEEKGYTREILRDMCANLKLTYYCMSDEIAPTTERRHTHLFMYRKSPIRFSTVKSRIPEAHIEICYGSCAENREYVSKIGKWANDPKADTSIPGTFEEWGVIPDERQEKDPVNSELVEAIDAGKSTEDIIRENPKFIFKSNDIDIARQTLKTSKFKIEEREVEVTYIFGETGVGKTRYVYDNFNPRDVCRITNYGKNNETRFDAYNGQDVLVFDEYDSQIPIASFLCYLDRYPLRLPARYSDRTACYTKVFILSNHPLYEQYGELRKSQPKVWAAFLRRINRVVEIVDGGKIIEHDKEEYSNGNA